ncbi:guanine deaminase [Enterovirga aerilata]|uniref:Guanine deaminase n=1 Tax=Enterovirga aerilata TaxID=2730920 RepID=A0A849I1H9_9HYPH|nr:guanine deaminase [Enterovirga sp. DB1703]NNM73636.1 guanine deaminase [Enterovirga sp. DB1703]
MIKAIRGRLLWYASDPEQDGAAARRYHEDGLLVVADGVIRAAGDAADLLRTLPQDTPIADHRPHLVVPGFIDAHIHYPQTQVVASYGATLLDWLERYTFVEEQRFADAGHAAEAARFFLDELLRNGTTTACVYCTVHPGSAEAFFAESERRGTRMLAGKLMMDRGAPPALLDTAESGYRDTRALIERWHGRGRQLYVISPRFALTSSEAQLEAAGRLAREHPGCLVQTHISENLREIEAVAALYPADRLYAAIYDRFGLLGPRSLLGHCLHLAEEEFGLIHARGAVAVFCPTSNTFLGSGLFDWGRMRDPRHPIRIAVATDIGGGTSYSMLATMGEAYKVLHLQGQSLSPDAAFHAMTRGNAVALGLEDLVGSFGPGHEGDAVVLDSAATPAMARRRVRIRTIEEELFLLTTMGDDRSVVATYVAGELAHRRAAP